MNTSIGFRALRALAVGTIALLAVSPVDLRSAGERAAAMSTANARLSGKTLVLAGRLPALTAAQATTLIEKAGGSVADRVTKTTNYVVAGARPGKKVEEARTLGIRVIDEAELRRMLGLPAQEAEMPKKKQPRKK